MKKIVLTGGGTAGHIYPALSVAENLTDFEKYYIGTNGMEKDIIQKQSNISFYEISAVKLERKFTFKNFLIPFKLFQSIKQAKKILKEIKPDVIFSKGGFVSVPVAIAGRKLKIPIVSHESDLSLGLANKIILHYCTVMCTTFEETATRKKCVFTGQPIRSNILHGKKLNFFKNSNPTILILGGSLGAKFLNDIVFDNIEKLTKNFNIIHITGQKNFTNIHKENYKQIAYSTNIQDLYKTADLVICRAGSGVINELLLLQKPMLLFPLSKKCSRGDQIENAKLFHKKDYCELIEEENYSFDLLIKTINLILKNKEKYQKSMQEVHISNANKKICEIINNLII